MADTQRVAGTAYAYRDGKQMPLGGSMTVSPNTVTREGVSGLSGPQGYTERPRTPFIEGDFVLTADLSLKEIQDFRDGVITVELANGKRYTLEGAFFAGDVEADASEGTVPLRFEGTSCTEH